MQKNVFYLQFNAELLRLIAVGTPFSHAEQAVVAVSKSENKRIEWHVVAVGIAAEQFTGHSSIYIQRPFAHPRQVVNEYFAAQQLFEKAFRAIKRNYNWWQLFSIAKLIIHPQRDFDGGLTVVEHRILQELGRGIGAASVVIHTGRNLTANEISQI